MLKILSLALTSYLVASPLYAETLDQAISRQQRDILKLEQQQERKNKLKDFSKVKELKKLTKTESFLEGEKIESKNCPKITRFDISGASIFNSAKQLELKNLFIGNCFSPANLNIALRYLTNFYHDQGYITTNIFIDPETTKKGRVGLIVVEGKIADIKFKDPKQEDSFLAPLRKRTAFANYKNEIFNLRNIEQGLDQLNRLPQNNTVMKILPGKEKGYSIVEIENNKSSPADLSLGFDNLGSTSTGKHKGKANLSYGDLLGLNDAWYASYSSDLERYSKEKFSKSLYWSLDIPYGDHNLKYNQTRASYKTTSFISNVSTYNSGQTENHNIALESIVNRGQTSKTKLNTNFAMKLSNSYSQGSKIDVSSYRLRVLSLGLNHVVNNHLGSISGTLTATKGLKILNAKKEVTAINFETARSDFKKYNLDLNYQKYFDLLGKRFSTLNAISGQVTNDHLYSTEQFSIGDAYSVRGFAENSLSGDSGYYSRNDLNYHFQNKYLGYGQFFLGYDYGFARVRGGKDSNYGEGAGYLASTSTGFKFSGNHYSLDLTYSVPLAEPSFNEEKEYELYLVISIR